MKTLLDEIIDSYELDQELENEVNRKSREYIQWVQRSLNKVLGTSLSVDGISGPKTRSAIRTFQQRFALTVDGIVGPQTENMLVLMGATPPPMKPAGGNQPPPSGRIRRVSAVPGGKILSEYLKRRSGGNHTGIDVSTSAATGGGAEDPRRGLPVYATLKPSIPIVDLNGIQVARTKKTLQTGLGIAGVGNAILKYARVRIPPKGGYDPDGGAGYGGVVGLACRYSYSKKNGSEGEFTLFIEYLHLITSKFLPYQTSRSKISLSAWQAAGKGSKLGFGERMNSGAVLSAAQLTASPPLLIGYLGATRWPHVHIQANYAQGKKDYIFYPRIDPLIMIY